MYSECILPEKILDMVNSVHYKYYNMTEWTPEGIKELRLKVGMTQRDFGLHIGVTREYVNKLEKGVRKPSKTMCILFDCIKNQEKGKGDGKFEDNR